MIIYARFRLEKFQRIFRNDLNLNLEHRFGSSIANGQKLCVFACLFCSVSFLRLPCTELTSQKQKHFSILVPQSALTKFLFFIASSVVKTLFDCPLSTTLLSSKNKKVR